MVEFRDYGGFGKEKIRVQTSAPREIHAHFKHVHKKKKIFKIIANSNFRVSVFNIILFSA